jgi:carbonic anhydrase/acetyltransferase-like protein (isoleucine patch superfamily)
MGMDGKVVGNPLFIAPNATVIGDVTLTAKVSIWFGAVVRADKDRIIIGEGSNIQDNCVVHTSRGHPVIIGANVSIGHGAILHGCTLGDMVLVGMGAIILNDAKVGSGSIIGAGALITEKMEVPAGSVVVGIPGKIIKQTTDAQKEHIISNARAYVDLASEYAHG